MAPIPSRPVSGRYRGRGDRYAIELRVDVDGPRPTRRISADYTRLSDGEPVGSLRIDEPSVTASATHVLISGTCTSTWQTTQRLIEVTIPLVGAGAAPAPATLRHRADDGRRGATYVCTFESPAFRTVELEEAVQRGVTKFESYDATSPDGRPRTLTYAGAFADAGIELRTSSPPRIVEVAGAGADGGWSDAELHDAMQRNFTRWADRPEWAIWLMHATSHESALLDRPGDGTLQGLMFDRRGAQRQGCAVFYDAMPGDGPTALREQLYTCVHELAHGFNLLHSWQKSMARPPVPSRPAATSWMNYPYRFPGGEKAFWSAFGFTFDDEELAHLRHAFRDDIAMGGSPFLSDAALERAPDWVATTENASAGLRLTLAMPASFAYAVPVTADLALAATTPEGRRVHTVLGPRAGTVDIAIARDGEAARVFEPMLLHCRGGETVLLRSEDPPIRDAALLHYGREGFPFRVPGVYDIRARHTAPDGSFALSNVVRIRIEPPRSAAEQAVGELTYGDEQTGELVSLMGSDAAALRRGNVALAQIAQRFAGHPMAAIARLTQGANAARPFRTITLDGSVDVRPPQPRLARALIDPVVDIARLQRALAQAEEAGGGRRAIAAALAAVGTRPGVAAPVAAFLRTRLGELVAVSPVIAAASAPRPPLAPPPGPPPLLDTSQAE